MPFDSIKTRQNWERLVAGEKVLNDIIPACDEAEKCGVDVEGRRLTATSIRDALVKLRSVLFPNGEPGS